jgi:enamine deaminase RidA (YjgF/YER057c/UK114 family)
MKRYGVEGGKGTGGQHMPFARAVEADGWLFVSGQTPMENGEVINGGIVEQSHKAIQNVFAILKEAGYSAEHVVRCGVWLDDPRDFASFNKVFREYFGENPPASYKPRNPLQRGSRSPSTTPRKHAPADSRQSTRETPC